MKAPREEIDRLIRAFAVAYTKDPKSAETLRAARRLLVANGEQLPVETEGSA